MVLQSTGSPILISQIRQKCAGVGASGVFKMSSLYQNNSAYYTTGISGVPSTGTVVKLSTMYSKQKALIPGLTCKAYSGYMSDNTSYFLLSTYSSLVCQTTDFTNIATATNNTYTINGFSSVSFEWFGYFLANATGTWTFGINSDDCSYMWVGANALSGYVTGNATTSQPGLRGVTSATTGTVSMTSGTYYPIRIQYGQNAGGCDCQVSFLPPSGSWTYNFSGYAFSSTGGSSSLPAESAQIIRGIYTTNTNGSYYINVNGTSTPIYCIMNSNYSGGGWMMLLKATRGSTFNYNASYWTTTNNLNPTDATANDGDAKYDTYNYNYIKDIMAIWPDTGYTGGSISSPDTGYWTWLYNNCYSSGTRALAATVFSQNADASTPYPVNFSGYSTNIWSQQSGISRYSIGGTAYCSTFGTTGNTAVNASVRWGFMWNNETDFASCDVSGGIGGTFGYGSYSAGDAIGCCQSSAGLNRSMRVMVFGR